jgi:hypothetical protein
MRQRDRRGTRRHPINEGVLIVILVCRPEPEACALKGGNASLLFGRRHHPANKLCKRRASRCRPHTPSRPRPLQQGQSSDGRRTAFVQLVVDRMRARSDSAPHHPLTKTAAIRVRGSSMRRRPCRRWHQARRVASINCLLDLQLPADCFPPFLSRSRTRRFGPP